ncbi:MAG: LacI family DNA-binding transcriptional regulator [Bacteroidota bacterium]|nr:LacI family DNA-binding transcriptional regulator [Bacteroidota bacterium]
MKEKDITIYDIAERLQISPATVSRGLKDHPAISQKTKKLVLDAAKKMGYQSNTFASNLRRRRTNTIGVIVPKLNSSFMSDALAGMEKMANSSGYNLIVTQSLETEKKEILNASTLFNNRVDGLIVSLSYDTKNINHIEPFFRKGIPVLFMDRVYEHKSCSTIVIDNHKAGYEMTSHLISQGCQNILHVTGNLSRNVYADRFEGYKQALLDHHLPYKDENLITNNLSLEDGEAVARKILEMDPLPDGVFVTSDLCAASIMVELKKSGVKIPESIAFGGFNNDPVSRLVEPGLTTINYKGFEMGELAIKIMISQLNQHQNITMTQSIVLGHDLIIRQSSLRNGSDTKV